MRIEFDRVERLGRANCRAAAFSLMETMVASSITLLVMAGAMGAIWFLTLGASGVAAQALNNQRAGNALEMIESRVRLAVCVSNDSSGNVLTLGYDDNPLTDSDGDGNAYDDRDHFERFQFLGVNSSTNMASTNLLVYIPNINRTNRQVLIPTGVRNLPGYNIFAVSNSTTVIVRFGVVDSYARDGYQSIDIQGTAVPLNRPPTTNQISIIP